MRTLAPILLLSTVCAALSPAALAKSDKSRVVKKALVQSVRVEVADGRQVVSLASGVVVAADASSSWVLTNAHVIEPLQRASSGRLTVLVERPKPVRLAARVVAQGKVPDEDLALLVVERSLPVAAVADEDEVGVGDDVVVIGAPYGRNLSVSSGIVSQLEIDAGQQTGMKTDAPIGYGASGGGVFEVPGGRLVGLVEGYRTARVSFTGARSEDLGFDVPMPGETFLTPPAKIRRFLRKAGLSRVAGLDKPAAVPEKAAAPGPQARSEP